jgi:thioredoxin 1
MRRILLALFAFIAIAAGPAFAKDFTPYDKAKLEAAIQSGASVVVHVHAEWCPICRRQVTVLDGIFKDPALSKLQTVRVSYDKDRDFISAFKVKRQANILVFKGGKEVARVDYDPDEGRIRAAVRSAL